MSQKRRTSGLDINSRKEVLRVSYQISIEKTKSETLVMEEKSFKTLRNKLISFYASYKFKVEIRERKKRKKENVIVTAGHPQRIW